MNEPYTDAHTQGPWHTGIGNSDGSIFSDTGRMRYEQGTVLYPIATMVRGWNDDEDTANAKLVAAAPCMFEALRKCECELAMHRSTASNPEAWEEALTAARRALEAAVNEPGIDMLDIKQQPDGTWAVRFGF